MEKYLIIGKINIVKMANLPKANYTIKATPIKNLVLTYLVGGCTVKGIDCCWICKPPAERQMPQVAVSIHIGKQ